MRKYLFLIFTSLSLLFALEVPQLAGYVNDKAGILNQQETSALDQYLKSFEEETSNQIFILTVDSLKGEPIFDYALQVYEQWQPGTKEKDNGTLLLIAKKERKVRINVGYGLEGVLTDAKSGEIIRYVIAPHFREGDYAKGLMSGVYAIVQAVNGEFHPSTTDTAYANQAVDNRVNTVFLISIFLALLSWTFFNNGKKKMPVLFGMIAAALMIMILGVQLPLLLLLLLIFLGGPLYAFFVMLLLIIFVSSRFGYYGGYGSRGRSFGSGGFGGFSGGGGGSFGGGGASGSW